MSLPKIEEILPNLYRIEIPLLGSLLKATNSYVVKASDRNLIIDTGWNHKPCMDVMLAGLKGLGVDLRKNDFFITHLHADHIGLLSNLKANTSTVYFNQGDAETIRSGPPWEKLVNFVCTRGFPGKDSQAVLHEIPGNKYGLKAYMPFSILKENDTITIGDYLFKCVLNAWKPPAILGVICVSMSPTRESS